MAPNPTTLPRPDTWRGFLLRLTSDEICAIDRMLFEAKR